LVVLVVLVLRIPKAFVGGAGMIGFDYSSGTEYRYRPFHAGANFSMTAVDREPRVLVTQSV